MKTTTTLPLLTLTATSLAQGFGGSGSNPFSNGDDDNGSSNNNNPFGNYGGTSGQGFNFSNFSFSRYGTVLTAHAVLATLAVAFFFPIGGILIRLASFPGLWWIHGLVQLFAYTLYTAAFGIGIWLISQSPSQLHLLNNAHPIIGIILFILLFFQPFLGVLHHVLFKRHNRRMVWSYGHIWLGRIIITLGIINGGLGLRLARRMPLAPPSKGAVIGYGIAAGVMWLAYVVSIVIGERRRNRAAAAAAAPPRYKEEHASSNKRQYA